MDLFPPRSWIIDVSNDPWARADRMAWEEEPLPADPVLKLLAAEFCRVESPSQLIHGDIVAPAAG